MGVGVIIVVCRCVRDGTDFVCRGRKRGGGGELRGSNCFSRVMGCAVRGAMCAAAV